MNIYLIKNIILGITYKPFDVTKMDSIVFIGKKPFITYNLSSSKKLIWVSWSFVNWFIEKKKSKNCNWGNMRAFSG